MFPYQAQGSLIEKDGKVIGSDADRPVVRRRQIFPWPAVGDQRARSEGSDQDRRRALQRRELGGLQSRPDQQDADRAGQGRRRKPEEGKPVGAGAGRPGDDLGQRPRSGHLARRRRYFQVPRVAKARGLPEAARARLGGKPDRGPHVRSARRAAGQRAAASISRSTALQSVKLSSGGHKAQPHARRRSAESFA